MNTTQRRAMRGRYHALFSELCRHFDRECIDEFRHQVSEWILGYKKSSSQWTGKEYSIVIDTMQEWIRGDVDPHELSDNERNSKSHGEEKKQLIYSIENLGAPEAYIQEISNDRHGKRPWRDHGVFQLKRLRMTITARVQSAKKQGRNLT